MIFVESLYPRTIGERFTLPQFEYGSLDGPQAIIIREATEQEYIDDCLADPTCPALMVLTGRTDRYWYGVETD